MGLAANTAVGVSSAAGRDGHAGVLGTARDLSGGARKIKTFLGDAIVVNAVAELVVAALSGFAPVGVGHESLAVAAFVEDQAAGRDDDALVSGLAVDLAGGTDLVVQTHIVDAVELQAAIRNGDALVNGVAEHGSGDGSQTTAALVIALTTAADGGALICLGAHDGVSRAERVGGEAAGGRAVVTRACLGGRDSDARPGGGAVE